jgi:hypothetical protein
MMPVWFWALAVVWFGVMTVRSAVNESWFWFTCWLVLLIGGIGVLTAQIRRQRRPRGP